MNVKRINPDLDGERKLKKESQTTIPLIFALFYSADHYVILIKPGNKLKLLGFSTQIFSALFCDQSNVSERVSLIM